jgi:3-oxoacyl-[acyl-carrier-protein] synthase I
MKSPWWGALNGSRVAPSRFTSTVPSLHIESAGLCCSVGYHLDAAVCAIRLNMDHFQESEFLTETGDPVNVGRMPDKDCWGTERMARWITWSVEDCLRDQPDFVSDHTVLIVLAPELERVDMTEESYGEIVVTTLARLGQSFHENSRILPLGKAGLAQALQYAGHCLSTPAIEQVMLVAGDSLLNVAAIEHFFEQERLIVPGNRDGFMPAEGAAALLLRRSKRAESGVVITGFAQAIEKGLRDGEIPNRSFGLTQAVRNACELAGVEPHRLQFRLSDQNGEAYLAREGSNAFTRIMAEGPNLSHLTLADKLGEIGAATGVAALAYLSSVMPRSDCSPGHAGVVHLSNDNGLRCSVLIQYQT